jgi:hypothetical protein
MTVTITKNGSFPWWLNVIVILGSVLMASGGVIALVKPGMLVSPGAQITEAVRVYAGYLVSRNLTLAAMLLAVLAARARMALGVLMVLTAFIQLFDAVLDLMEGRLPLAPGVIIIAIAFFLGAARVSGYPFWKAEAWREGA